MAGKLEQDLKKRKPFHSPQQAVVIGLLRTADLVQYRRGQFLRDYDLTQPQYNVLRILRGAGTPLPSLEIASRMVTMVPAITSLLDKLEQKGLITRERNQDDRRVWNVGLTEAGETLLSEIDDPFNALEKGLCRGLSAADCRRLADLMEKARAGLQSADEV